MRLLLHRGNSFDPNFYYHAGLDMDHSFLLVEGGKRTLFVPKLNEALALAEFRGKVVVYDDAVKTLSKYLAGKTVHFDANSLSARNYMRLAKVCGLRDHSLGMAHARAVKRPAEVAAIRKAAAHAREIIESLDFGEAKTELGLRKQLLVATAGLGLEPAFEPIVSTDANTAYPHREPTNKKLGSLVMVDYGVKYGHYHSDITRCFILDGDRRKKAEYAKLREICHSIVDAMPELEKGRDVAALAAKLMKRANFPKMIHSVGHGVGLEIHEFPRLGLKSDDRIAGTAVAIEPAFYLGRYGMRYEETVWFNGKKARIL